MRIVPILPRAYDRENPFAFNYVLISHINIIYVYPKFHCSQLIGISRSSTTGLASGLAQGLIRSWCFHPKLSGNRYTFMWRMEESFSKSPLVQIQKWVQSPVPITWNFKLIEKGIWISESPPKRSLRHYYSNNKNYNNGPLLLMFLEYRTIPWGVGKRFLGNGLVTKRKVIVS
jgi:hypothetical protein